MKVLCPVEVTGLARQRDGKVVLVGNFGILRLSGRNWDRAFGDDGFIRAPAEWIVVQPSGKLLLGDALMVRRRLP